MYLHPITRISRSAVIIAIDGSISMEEETLFHETPMRKREAAALIANFFIDELLMRSTRAGDLRDYYDIAIFRYTNDNIEPIIASEEMGLVHINSLQEAIPQPVCYNIVGNKSDGTQSMIPLTLNEWVTPHAYGSAPMYEMFVHIKGLITKWCDDRFNRHSFPPIIVHISDGWSSDAEEEELLDIAEEIKSIGTKEGNTLLVNIYLSNRYDEATSIVFPSHGQHIDQDAQMLYDMSSLLPDELEGVVMELTGSTNNKPYKCFARNAALCEILTLADIGTEECKRHSI